MLEDQYMNSDLFLFFLPTVFSSSIKKPLVLYTPCCAAMMQIFATRTLRSGLMLQSSTCPLFQLSWRYWISFMTSQVSIHQPLFSLTNVHFHHLQKISLQCRSTWECFYCFCRLHPCSGPTCLSPWRCWPRQWQHYQSVCCHGNCRLPFAACQSQPLCDAHSGEW